MKIREADEAQREDNAYHQAKADQKNRANKREGTKLWKCKSQAAKKEKEIMSGVRSPGGSKCKVCSRLQL
jgi:hypothetical protein